MESELCEGNAQINSSLGSVHVETQKRRLGNGTTRIVSVLITDDISDLQQNPPIDWRDEDDDAVYDGVIEYSDGTTLIIENKPRYGEIWHEQLYPSTASVENPDDIVLVTQPVYFEWSGLLERLVEYTKLNFSNFTARKLINDFLSYVERFGHENNLNLTPYRTFHLCDGNDMALDRRIILLLDEILGHVKDGVMERRYNGLYRPHTIAERICICLVRSIDSSL